MLKTTQFVELTLKLYFGSQCDQNKKSHCYEYDHTVELLKSDKSNSEIGLSNI
jgi:hypothetical protein